MLVKRSIQDHADHFSDTSQDEFSTKSNSVVETTDADSELGYHTVSEEIARLEAILKRPEPSSFKNNLTDAQIAELKGTSPMQELRSPYVRVGHPHNAKPGPTANRKPNSRWGKLASRLTLFQKIFISNMVIIVGGAVVGSWLTAQLAVAGQFNAVTFSIIIILAVLFSGAVSFMILTNAFRPFGQLQQVLSKIHTGNPRARAALHHITDPDVRHFTVALNQMLTRLEDNAHVIQEDQRQLQLMTAQVINAQENERKRIARELHDEASQSLTAMIMGLEAARNTAPAENISLQNQLASLKELAIATLEELRKLALDLRPTMLDDLGLIAAMRWLSRGAAEQANLDVQVTLDGFDEQERLAPALETCLFRITQESLTNIVKHAQASTVQVRLERVAPDAANPTEQVRLTIKDNGCGFELSAARAKAYRGGHLGLFDIEERAALLGGMVNINSLTTGPTLGTCIAVLVPLHGRQVEQMQGLNTSAPPYVK